MSILNQHKKIFSLVQVELEKLGFSEFVYEPHFYSLDATKKFGDLTYNLTFQLLSKSISLGYVYGFILVNPVNKILKQFIPDLSDNNELITLKNHINGGKQEDFKKINEHLKTKNTGDYITAIMEHIKKIDFPFFNKYSTLEAINQEIINKVPEEDYFEWFPGVAIFKVLIIMKLRDNSKYEEYKNKRVKVYLSFVEKQPALYQDDYITFLSFLDYIDSGSYLKINEKDNMA
ncbi:hypothetical protein I2486_07620 [Cellulophaga sp. E16_2]|uniref:Uncharacterized protein n=1 Tax=Cellulophaga algicola (strain DSM 14237 / IC166 / ACAM 630) TaxID=688270 RepID=E6XAA7_CELAD|nr:MULTISPECIES: hypothetical protein [Cellulophaga]ADV48806.1 hypothetical protein Celal_1494 [Cellulophaga algicola DSM 14237]MBO0591275.1 hypothetical protein [Cellulophaga sp. E16_2]